MIYKFKNWVQLDKCETYMFSFIQKLNLIEEYAFMLNNEDIELMSSNPNAVPYLTLKENENKICWELFMSNPDAIEHIKKYKHIVDFNWEKVIEILNNTNPIAIQIFENQIYDLMNEVINSDSDNDGSDIDNEGSYIEIDNENETEGIYTVNVNNDVNNNDEENHLELIYSDLTSIIRNWISSNPATISLLEKNHNYIDWGQLSKNPKAIHLLEQNKDKINWDNLSGNENAINLLLQHPHKINWRVFSSNTNPIAIKMLEENPDKINWGNLTRNPSAIHLLEANLDKVVWQNILLNPNIYDYDYTKMKQNMNIIREEMMIKVWNPMQVIKWIEAECYDILE